MEHEKTNTTDLYGLLSDFYKTHDWESDEQKDDFLEKLSSFCLDKNCRCRPNYHEVARFVMENWNENDSLDYFIEALEAISEDIKTLTAYENLCKNEDGKKCNLNDFFIKMVDHIKLEQLRLNSLAEELKREYQRNVKKQNELSLQLEMFQSTLDMVDANNKRVDTELSRNKFDLIALTTLIFSAFTLIQINVSTFAAMACKPIGDAILLMAMVNIIVISSIMAVYSVIRKIHNDMTNEELYFNVFCMLTILILVGLFGYFIF